MLEHRCFQTFNKMRKQSLSMRDEMFTLVQDLKQQDPYNLEGQAKG